MQGEKRVKKKSGVLNALCHVKKFLMLGVNAKWESKIFWKEYLNEMIFWVEFDAVE